MERCGDGDIAEYRVGDVITTVPLHDIGFARLDASQVQQRKPHGGVFSLIRKCEIQRPIVLFAWFYGIVGSLG